MEFFHNGLVYLLYTIYLLLVIVGFLTKDDMPQIGVIQLATNGTGTVAGASLAPFGASPGKEAHWSTDDFPELGRRRLDYSFRKADPNTGLVRHSFKVTVPTLKSVVTDPSGPYAPPPAVDYVTVAEMNLFIHSRATSAERLAAWAAFSRSDLIDDTFAAVIRSVLNGETVF